MTFATRTSLTCNHNIATVKSPSIYVHAFPRLRTMRYGTGLSRPTS